MQMVGGARTRSRLSVRRFRHGGAAPVRVLLVGDRDQLLGRGTTTQAERAADRIWLTTRRGVDLDVLGDLAPVLRAISGVSGGWRRWRYDVVVVVLGDGLDARTRPRTLHRTGELLREVLADAADATEVLVVGPALQPHRPGGEAQQRLQRAIAGLASGRVRFGGVPWSDDPEERARSWSDMVGAEVARSVARAEAREPQVVPPRAAPVEGAAQRRASDALHLVSRPADPRLDDLVELARSAFGTESAEITFIDRDRQWRTTVAGADRGVGDRVHAFCDQTIGDPHPLVVGDTRMHPVLRSSPMANGLHPIRFYAAHPIESGDGHRFGSFCIYDPEPRDVRGMDLSVLRDLALLAQAELVPEDTAPRAAASRFRRS